VPAKQTTDSTGRRLRVKQVRSGIGHVKGHRATLRSIGLKHHQDVVVVSDTPSMRGMLNRVRHLVEVTPVEEG
jgi:large subunit ribosomal protein L30